MKFTTADLCDAFALVVHVVDPIFRDFGRVNRFSGAIETLRVLDDNALVDQVLETAGGGRVLVVDGGGSLRTALVGGRLAALAHRNGWAGLVVNGCVRDSGEIRKISLGSFAGATFAPGQYLYADEDGIVVADRSLSVEGPALSAAEGLRK